MKKTLKYLFLLVSLAAIFFTGYQLYSFWYVRTVNYGGILVIQQMIKAVKDNGYINISDGHGVDLFLVPKE